jgi:hypothetical protein
MQRRPEGLEMKMIKTALLIALFAGQAFAQAPPSYSPTNAERARWTMSDMRSWAICFKSYAKDHETFPAQAPIKDLRQLFQPTYVRVLPLTDAWGHEYRVLSDGKHFTVVSAGADGKFDEKSWSMKARDLEFSDDAVITDDSGMALLRSWKFE